MKTQRIYYYDVLNVVSCLSVIALHCNGYVHSFDTTDKWWWLHVLFEVAFYNAVPIFFMLSGATLLGYNRKYDTKTFFKKRFRKTFLPFLTFTIAFYTLYLLTADLSELSLGGIVHNLFSGNIPHTNFWFFVPLFLMYLFMPFLSAMVTNITNRQLLGLIVLMVGLQGIAQPILMQVDVTWQLPIGSYVAYLLLGYYLAKTTWEKNNKVLATITIAGALLMVGRYVGIYLSDEKPSILFNYLSLYGFCASSAIFLIIKRLCRNGGGGNSYSSFHKEVLAYI